MQTPDFRPGAACPCAGRIKSAGVKESTPRAGYNSWFPSRMASCLKTPPVVPFTAPRGAPPCGESFGMLCITLAMHVRVQNGMICPPTPRVVCPRHTQAVWWAKGPSAHPVGCARRDGRIGPQTRPRLLRFEPLRGRGFAGAPRRCKTRQGVQPCLGFCALRFIPQKPRRARRESCRASLSQVTHV